VFTRLELCVPKFCGGSTEKVSVLLHELRQRDPDVAEELAAWAFHTTRNPYVPFGTQNVIRASASSIAEFRRRTHERLMHVTADEDARGDEAAKRKEERRLAHEQRSEQHHEEIRQRAAELDALLSLSAAQRLRHIADDLSRSPYFYPEAWAVVSADEVAELGVDVVKRLQARLVRPPRGPWRDLARCLRIARDGAAGATRQ
jgi:hypothetical protein